MDAGATYDDVAGGQQMEEDGENEDTEEDVDLLMTAGSVNDENMINLEMVEQMEVRFQYNKAAKEVLVCQKPDVAQGGTALVKTDCKHLVE